MELLLLHSPLTGPVAWSALAPILRARGHHVFVPDLRLAVSAGPPFFPKLVAFAAMTRDPVIVAHSGAGALVPLVAEATGARRAIYLDALLPHPGRCWFDTAPEDLAGRLRAMAGADGLLPSWDRWWPKGTMEALLPDDAMRAAFIADLPRPPLGYFEEILPAAREPAASAYLRLSETYEIEARQTVENGWPLARLELHHLAMLTHPGAVGEELLRLAAAL